MKSRQINFRKSIPFFLMHLSVLAAFVVPFQWEFVGLCLASYFLRMFAITGGYHRYFSHRSYKMGRVPQFLMAFLGCTATQKGPLWWAANHRLHHRHSDLPTDVHSPVQHGFWWSHVGWILANDHDPTRFDQVQDLAKFPELRFLNRFFLFPVVLYATAFFLIGGWGALVWGYFISTVLLWHGTFTINSLSHVYGSKRYATSDESRNNFWLALITLGEGWHNNHHCYMSSTKQGFYWWEIDVTYYVLKPLSWMKIVGDLRTPPLKSLEAKRLKPSPHNQTPNSRPSEQAHYLERA